jgi:hypothetical protein
MQIQLYCTDRDKSVNAEIANLREGKSLEAVIEKSIKIRLDYNLRHQIYVGSTNGLEFTIKAVDIPKEYTHKPFSRSR